jgi:hypothetical protein
LGTSTQDEGIPEAAAPVLERAIELCRTAEIRRQIVPCASILCYAYAASGRHAEAHRLIDRTIADVAGGWGATATWLPWLAEGAMLVGRNAEGFEIAQRALNISIDRKERGSEAHAKTTARRACAAYPVSRHRRDRSPLQRGAQPGEGTLLAASRGALPPWL